MPNPGLDKENRSGAGPELPWALLIEAFPRPRNGKPPALHGPSLAKVAALLEPASDVEGGGAPDDRVVNVKEGGDGLRRCWLLARHFSTLAASKGARKLDVPLKGVTRSGT